MYTDESFHYSVCFSEYEQKTQFLLFDFTFSVWTLADLNQNLAFEKIDQ